ncbi:MAG: cyclase family protein [Dehalobacterium sp.]
MAEYIDLSRVLTPGVGEIPGHPATKIEEFQTHVTHDRTNAQLAYSIHCGTHVDCPYHFFSHGDRIDELSPDRFIGQGVLVDLKDKVNPGEAISREKIINNSQIPSLTDGQLAQSIVLINSGWGLKYQEKDYYKCNPYLSEEAAKFFAEKKVKAVGLDFPPDGKQGAIVHRTLLEAKVLIIENLTNLDALKDVEFQVFALPIKIFQQSGGPARVIASL